MAKKKEIKKGISTSKTFSYNFGNCNLNYSLNVDNDVELKDFRKILVQNLEDIDRLLKTFK